MVWKHVTTLLFLVSSFCNVLGNCPSAPLLYDRKSCRLHFNAVIESLLRPFNNGITNEMISNVPSIQGLHNNVLRLRIKNKHLFCVADKRMISGKKNPYRALPFVKHVLKALLQLPKDASNFDLWVQFADAPRYHKNSTVIRYPIFSQSSSEPYWEIPALPAWAMEKKSGRLEKNEILNLHKSFSKRWREKMPVAFFLGSLSGCLGNFTRCPRGEMIRKAQISNDPLMADIKAVSSSKTKHYFQSCASCVRNRASPKEYAKLIITHKYVLHLGGVGGYSAR
mmetsp:Transcript_39963/g.127830  ORF Transcript_39963/g.127830 Transcript_39963/m.127830 type:complete len:281 (+) Transcript_39963:619-1461(+)